MLINAHEPSLSKWAAHTSSTTFKSKLDRFLPFKSQTDHKSDLIREIAKTVATIEIVANNIQQNHECFSKVQDAIYCKASFLFDNVLTYQETIAQETNTKKIKEIATSLKQTLRDTAREIAILYNACITETPIIENAPQPTTQENPIPQNPGTDTNSTEQTPSEDFAQAPVCNAPPPPPPPGMGAKKPVPKLFANETLEPTLPVKPKILPAPEKEIGIISSYVENMGKVLDPIIESMAALETKKELANVAKAHLSVRTQKYERLMDCFNALTTNPNQHYTVVIPLSKRDMIFKVMPDDEWKGVNECAEEGNQKTYTVHQRRSDVLEQLTMLKPKCEQTINELKNEVQTMEAEINAIESSSNGEIPFKDWKKACEEKGKIRDKWRRALLKYNPKTTDLAPPPKAPKVPKGFKPDDIQKYPIIIALMEEAKDQNLQVLLKKPIEQFFSGLFFE